MTSSAMSTIAEAGETPGALPFHPKPPAIVLKGGAPPQARALALAPRPCQRGLLALVFSRIDLGKVGSRLSSGHWGLFVAAVALVLVALLLAAYRWHLFLGMAGVGRTLPEATRAYLIGAFTTNFLPSQFGGDVTRAWIAGRAGTRVRAAATVLIDFVDQEQIERSLRSALCLVLPSRGEGYGLVVVEAIARGTPVVVVDGPDNAPVEFVEEGVNGVVATSASPRDLGEAMVQVHRAGQALRDSTTAWFARNAEELSRESSLTVISRRYRGRR